jgi:hypothetical protein
MKKLTLTFCALFALVVVAPALYADGPEPSSKEKEVMQPAPPVCDFYRAHEWDLSIWGAYAFAADTGQNNVPNDDPFFNPNNTGFQETDVTNTTQLTFLGIPLGPPTVTEPANFNPQERVNIGRVSNNQLFARDDAWGGGADIKYFWSRYFGVGLEGVGLAAKTNFAGGGLLTLTGRYPFGRFAPYVTGGIGFIDGGATLYKFFNERHNDPNPTGTITNEQEFWTVDPVSNNHVRALGQIGAGLEFRVTCHIGLMADFTWNFVFGQEDHADKIHLITEQGISTFTTTDTILGTTTTTSTVVINQANELRPGHGSDNQDFGMARFGVTFSY